MTSLLPVHLHTKVVFSQANLSLPALPGQFSLACSARWVFTCLLCQVRMKDKDCGGIPWQVKPHQVAISCLIKDPRQCIDLWLETPVREYFIRMIFGRIFCQSYLQVVPDLGRLAWIPSQSWSLIPKAVSYNKFTQHSQPLPHKKKEPVKQGTWCCVTNLGVVRFSIFHLW